MICEISKDWCLNMAQIEGDAEIGSGLPDQEREQAYARDRLRTALYSLRNWAGDESHDGPSGVDMQRRALCAYEWLGDHIEAFLDDCDATTA